MAKVKIERAEPGDFLKGGDVREGDGRFGATISLSPPIASERVALAQFSSCRIDPRLLHRRLVVQPIVYGFGDQLSIFSKAPRLNRVPVRKLIVNVASDLAGGRRSLLALLTFAPIVMFSIMVHGSPVEAGAFPMPSVADVPQKGPAILALNHHHARAL